MPFAEMWMDLETVKQTSKSKREKYCVTSLINVESRKVIEMN